MLLVSGASVQAGEVVVTGSPMKNFGRIVLQFDTPTKVQTQASNGILIIRFGAPARIKTERLAKEVGSYVAAARRDPDDTGLRIALQSAFRANVMEAGEKVFIDLLPQNWAGLPPSLPAEVVKELAARAQAAEERLRAGEPARPSPRRVRLEMAELPNLTRLVFAPPRGQVPRIMSTEGGLDLAFDGPATLDEGGFRPKLAAGVSDFETGGDARTLRVTIRPAAGYAIHSFQEGDTAIVDLAKPAAQASSGPPPREVAPVPPKAPDPDPPSAARPVEKPAMAPQEEASQPQPSRTPARLGPSSPPATIVPVIETSAAGTSTLFPFRSPTPAAAFERGGLLTLVFATRDQLDDRFAASVDEGAARPIETRAEDGLLVLHYDAARLGPSSLVREGPGWRLASGATPLPPDAVGVSRAVDTYGHARATVSLSGAAKAFWITGRDGSRLAVVPAFGRLQNLPVARHFVEFTLPPTLHGLVVEARSDDLVVEPLQDGVTISRSAGLTLSFQDGIAADSPRTSFVLSRDTAQADPASIVPRYYELVAEASNAPRSGRAEARFRLARFLIGLGLNQEASSILTLASADDQVFRLRHETRLLSGIASVRAGRLQQARQLLGQETVGDGPEPLLWRAVVDSEEGRWSPALAGFRGAGEVIDRYPDEIAGWVRQRILAAAIGAGDVRRAEGELAAIDRLPTGSIPRDEHDLARARVDEAAGRIEAALKGYEKLVEDGTIRASSEARLRGTRLARTRGLIDRDDAIARLETLSVIWRGGATEIETIDELARLYGDAGRWREMFAMARRANRYFPDHERTRSLHEHATSRLENLLLGPEGEQLTTVQALSLYFDFKEMTPVGRRGDEIVRRLADRLVELDLMEQASDLLQYQVDKRLTGVAKATVAARLAAIRLLSGKPLLALSTLQSSRLADLPQSVRRFRFVLEARAQSDLSRVDLALESIANESGPDFDRLRTSILWSARRWQEAGESGEALVGTRWEGPEPLSDRDRNDVIRAAIAYAAADERIALDRIREKFSRKMLDSPDAKTFAVLVQPGAVATREFRTIAQEATRTDSLKLLLSDWSERHPEPIGNDPTLPGAETMPAAPVVSDRRPPA